MKYWVMMVFLWLVVTVPVLSVDESVPTVSWHVMEGLNTETGEMTKELSVFNNKTVEVAGFIVPIEMDEDFEKVIEFLLVPNPLACLHIPPPPPNQIVYVTMAEPIPLDMDFRGVAITGHLTTPRPKAEYGLISFELEGVSAKPANIEFDDPLEDLINSHQPTGDVFVPEYE